MAIIREFDRNNPADQRLIENICKESGSPVVAKEANFIRRAIWNTKDHPENLWCEIYDDCAFWMAIKCKNTVRSVFTVVRQDRQKEGIGNILHRRSLRRCMEAGISTLRRHTSQNERAIDYWTQKQGATIVGLNGNDFELEFRIKLP